MKRKIGDNCFDTEKSTEIAKVVDTTENEENTLFITENRNLFMVKSTIGYYKNTTRLVPVSAQTAIEFLEKYRKKLGEDIVDEIYKIHFYDELQDA